MHYTCLVVGDDWEEQLAPFDENIEAKPYKRYWDSSDLETWEKVLSEKESQRRKPESSLHDPEMETHVFPPEHVLPEEWTLEDMRRVYLARYHNGDDGEYEGEPEDERIFIDDGGIYTWSTYNQGWIRNVWCPGYNPTNHAGSEADQSTWDEVLREVRADEALGGFSQSSEESRRKVHLLLSVYEGEERSPDSGDEDGVEVERAEDEVRDHGGGLRRAASSSGRDVLDLPSTAEREEAGSGSLPHDWESARSALRELQRDLGSRGGELRFASCGSEVPHAAHELRSHRTGGSKWDWYQIGGRWRGFFKLKEHAKAGAVMGSPGSFGNEAENDADQAQKGDIDIAWMRDTAGSRAGEVWDTVNPVIADLPVAQSWEHFLGLYKLAEATEGEDYSIEQARKDYHAQERVVALTEWNNSLPEEERILGFFGPSVEDFQVDRDEYVQRARDNACCPYAYLRDGEWHAPGKMGWFASSDTEAERLKFQREFNEVLDALPDDTLLTLVDLHI